MFAVTTVKMQHDVTGLKELTVVAQLGRHFKLSTTQFVLS